MKEHDTTKDLRPQYEAAKLSDLFKPTTDIMEWFVEERYSHSWRPTNIAFDISRIKSSPDSVVFFEDIEPYLFFFNDENLHPDLLNLLLSYLGKKKN